MQRTSHRQITLPDGQVWMMELDAAGNLRMRKRHARRGVTITAEELARKADQLYNGSIGLFVPTETPQPVAITLADGVGSE